MTKEALETERRTVEAVADVLRSTLGPNGANKLVVQANGSVSTTNAGRVVLDRLDRESPFLTLLEGAVSELDDGYGDGTTTLLALVGALASEADRLVGIGCHPTVVRDGYAEAFRIAREYVETYGRPLSEFSLDAVARTAFTGSRNPHVGNTIAELVVDTFEAMDRPSPGEVARRVEVVARTAGTVSESKLIEGVVLEQDPVVEGMARTAPDAGVALLNTTVDLPRVAGNGDGEGSAGARLTVGSFEDRAGVAEWERATFRDALESAIDAGCRVVVTTEAVNDRVKTTLASRGVLALQRVESHRFARLARATGARAASDLTALNADDLGWADVSVRRVGGRDLTFVERPDSDVRTLFCRAPSPRSVESFERAVASVLSATAHAEYDGRVVPGGGAVEVGAAHAIREAARSVADRRQLAMVAYADALTTIPRTLARNAGADPATALARLHAAHADGRSDVGVDALDGSTRRMLGEDPAIDPASIKGAAWSSATELVAQTLRIDDVL